MQGRWRPPVAPIVIVLARAASAAMTPEATPEGGAPGNADGGGGSGGGTGTGSGGAGSGGLRSGGGRNSVKRKSAQKGASGRGTSSASERILGRHSTYVHHLVLTSFRVQSRPECDCLTILFSFKIADAWKQSPNRRLCRLGGHMNRNSSEYRNKQGISENRAYSAFSGMSIAPHLHCVVSACTRCIPPNRQNVNPYLASSHIPP